MHRHQTPTTARFRPSYPGTLAPKTGTTPAPRAQDRTLKIQFEIAEQFMPALASAIEEEKNEVGGRLEGSFSFASEKALTDGAVGLGVLYAALQKAIREHNEDAPKFRRLATAHPDWRTR